MYNKLKNNLIVSTMPLYFIAHLITLLKYLIHIFRSPKKKQVTDGRHIDKKQF